jgi:multiple sugar transport system ATP-binding protein
MARVVLKKVEKVYPNGFRAVQGIDLDIRDGEFMVLVGPSGCAKSTILRMIAGLEDISTGEVWIGPRMVNEVEAKDRDISMVFQHYALYPHMTAYENLAFVLKLRKMAKDEVHRRVMEAAEILDITAILKQKPKQMSGGQMQRVAVGRAIVRHPEVFLFDEPLSNLDAKLRVQMRVEITKLHRNLKSTMIYVTHDQVEAMTMGDRICVVESGRIMQVDTPANLYRFPANKFVAGFIGSPAMNLVSGRLTRNGEVYQVELPSCTLRIPKAMGVMAFSHLDREIIFGIRPEDIHSQLLCPQAKDNHAQFEVDMVENMGSNLFAYFTIGDGQCIAQLAPDVAVANGKRHALWFNTERCHLFDPETGESLLQIRPTRRTEQ